MWLPAGVARPRSTGALKLGQVSNAVTTLNVQVIKTVVRRERIKKG
nr:MAG TPA: hypothetical protein [Caudoviricetes sp.]